MTEAALPWSVERSDKRSIIVRMDTESGEGWEQWFLLRSDAHHDHAEADRDAELAHLREAQERNAGIIDIGDLFCAMQGKWDKRSDRSALREEYQCGPYLDTLVDEATKHYGPFAREWISMSPGNHETAIIKNHETNLTERLVARMNAEHGGTIERLPYANWIIFRVYVGQKKHLKMGSVKYYGFHGSGGGGPVTKGVIQTNRRAASIEGASVIHTGHVHESWNLDTVTERCNEIGRPIRRTVTHVSTPGYKDEFAPGDGWHVETGKPPKPKGAAWLRLYWRNDELHADVQMARSK